jgi:hypothetical protein
MRKLRLLWAAIALSSLLGLAAFAGTVGASTTVVVMPTNTQGWSTADTNAGGAVNFAADATAPSG